MSLSEWGPHIN